MVIDFIDNIKDRLGGHESVARVKDQNAARVVHVCGGLEALPHINVKAFNLDGIGVVKESWPSTKSNHTTDRAHGLVHYDVEDLRIGLVVVPLTDNLVVTDWSDGKLVLCSDPQGVRLVEKFDFNVDTFTIDLLGSPNGHTGVIEGTSNHLDLSPIFVYDLLDVRGARHE